MSVDENKEQSQAESSAENKGEQGTKGTTQPSTPYTKEEVTRIGVLEDSRGVSDQKGDSTPEPRETLRDGT